MVIKKVFCRVYTSQAMIMTTLPYLPTLHNRSPWPRKPFVPSHNPAVILRSERTHMSSTPSHSSTHGMLPTPPCRVTAADTQP